MKKLIKKIIAVILSASLISSSSFLSVFAAPYDILGHWASEIITKWTNQGYIKGYPDGSFRPDNSISRAEFVVLVNKAFNFSQKANIYFTDLNFNHWGYSEIQKGVAAGYIKGDSAGTFRPDSPVTRQEAAVIMSQVKALKINSSGATKYSDYYKIADWAKGYVGAASIEKVLSGFPDGSFRGTIGMTRAETVTALEGLKSVPYGGTIIELPNNNNDNNNTIVENKNYTLDKTFLSDKTITGDLIISKDLANKSVNLENINVEGSVYVYGGNIIQANNCIINKLVLDKSSVEFKTDSKSNVSETKFKSNGKITGKGYKNVIIDDNKLTEVTVDASVSYVELDADVKLKFYSNASVKTLNITNNADYTSVSLSNSAKITDMEVHDKIKITGHGDIETMTVYVSGIESEIRPSKVITRNNSSNPKYLLSSSSSSNNSRYDNLVIMDKNINLNGKGDKYDDVRIRASSADISNLKVYGDLIIEKSVGDGSVTLTDIEVRGKVYIYGGDFITFRNCNLKEDIVSNTSDRYVKLMDSEVDYASIKFNENIELNGKSKIQGSSISSSKNIEKISNTNAVIKAKSSKNDYVTIRFDKNTELNGKLIVQSNTIVSPYASTEDITINSIDIEGKLDKGLILKTNVNTININENSVVTVSSGKSVNSLTIRNKLNDIKITMEGGNSLIKNINANSKFQISGNGKVNNIITDNEDNIVKYDGIVIDDVISQYTAVKDIKGISSEGTKGVNVVLTPIIEPSNASNQNIVWDIKNPNDTNAYINNNILNAENAGNVTLIATIKNGLNEGKDFVKEFNIEIKENTPKIIEVSDIKGIPNEGLAGVDIVLTPIIEPSNASNQNIVWNIKNPNDTNVYINDNVLNAENAGNVTLIATIKNGLNEGKDFVKEFNIEIKENTPKIIEVSDIKGIPNEGLAGVDIVLTPIIEPSNASNQNIVWSIKNPNDTNVYINDNVLNAENAGNITLIATIKNGLNEGKDFVKEFNIEIKENTPKIIEVSDIKGIPNEGLAGIDIVLTPIIEPSNASNQNIVWSIESPDNTNAYINDNILNAENAGNVTLIATIKNGLNEGKDFVKEFNIEIKDNTPKFIAVNDIKLNCNDTFIAGEELILDGQIIPNDATVKNIEWSTNNKYVYLEGNKLTCQNIKEPINIVVTATVFNGDGENSNFSKNFDISIQPTPQIEPVNFDEQINTFETFVPVDSIEFISPTSFTAGTELELYAKINPDNATSNNIEWSIINRNSEFPYIHNGYILKCNSIENDTVIIIVRANIKNADINGNDLFIDIPITINSPSLNIVVGQKFNLSSLIKPSESFNKNIKWTIKNNGTTYSKIDEEGNLIPTNLGIVVVNALITDRINPYLEPISKDFSISVTQ